MTVFSSEAHYYILLVAELILRKTLREWESVKKNFNGEEPKAVESWWGSPEIWGESPLIMNRKTIHRLQISFVSVLTIDSTIIRNLEQTGSPLLMQ